MTCVDNQKLKEIGTFINNIIDFDESRNSAQCSVKKGVDDDLDEKKRLYYGLDDFLVRFNLNE